jgi:spore maturation protein B
MELIKVVSAYAIPAVFFIILCSGLYKGVKVYEVFVDGAKEGLSTTARIVPSLVGLMVAIGVFRASGALDLIAFAVKPLASVIGMPFDAIPLAFLRPISGSASLALVSDIIKTHGADSFVGRLVSTMMGSSETIFYTMAVYFGAVGIKKIRHTLCAALIAEAASVFASLWICTAVFGK